MNELDIRLEKSEYLAGEEVNGNITLSVDNDMEFKNFNFQAIGKEDPQRNIPDYHEDATVVWRDNPYDNSYGYRPPSEKASNIFFCSDLLKYFTISPGLNLSNDSTLEIKKGQRTVPFHFTIPSNSLESFDGKYVSITYEVAATASGIFMFDHHNQIFTVLNPNYKQEVKVNTISLFDKPIIWDWEEQEKTKRGVKVRVFLDNDKYTFSPGDIVRVK